MKSTITTSVSIVAIIILQCLAPSGSAYTLQIHPRHVHRHPSETVQIKCLAEDPITPLTHCRFERMKSRAGYNLDKGQLTKTDDDYKYIGKGLDQGECGIEFSDYNSFFDHDIVECKVRTEEQGWKYASALVEIYNESSKFPYSVSPASTTVQKGGEVHALGRSNISLASCSYAWIDDDWILYNQDDQLHNTDGQVDLGEGLENGDCAVTLHNVTQSGVVVFLAFNKTDTRADSAMSHMTVIVPNAPKEMTLALDKKVYSEGTLLDATCSANTARPVSNLTWYLDGEVVRNDTLNDEDDSLTRWRWSYLPQDITQTLTRTLTWEDDGKELVCRTGHFALPSGQQDSKTTLKVQYAPRLRLEHKPAEFKDFNVGATGVITCRYHADPKPVVNWQFEETNAGSAVAAGRYNWSEVRQIDGAWVTSLTIINLTRHDNAQALSVLVRNTHGSSRYRLVLDVRGERDEQSERDEHRHLHWAVETKSTEHESVLWLSLTLGLIAFILHLIIISLFIFRRRGNLVTWFGRRDQQSDVVYLKEI